MLYTVEARKVLEQLTLFRINMAESELHLYHQIDRVEVVLSLKKRSKSAVWWLPPGSGINMGLAKTSLRIVKTWSTKTEVFLVKVQFLVGDVQIPHTQKV